MDLRIRKEMESMRRLAGKADYLSRYNYALRLMIIDLLSSNEKVDNNTVHPLFRDYMIQVLGIKESEAYEIIKMRHKVKYTGIEANPSTLSKLNSVIQLIPRNVITIV